MYSTSQGKAPTQLCTRVPVNSEREKGRSREAHVQHVPRERSSTAVHQGSGQGVASLDQMKCYSFRFSHSLIILTHTCAHTHTHTHTDTHTDTHTLTDTRMHTHTHTLTHTRTHTLSLTHTGYWVSPCCSVPSQSLPNPHCQGAAHPLPHRQDTISVAMLAHRTPTLLLLPLKGAPSHPPQHPPYHMSITTSLQTHRLARLLSQTL